MAQDKTANEHYVPRAYLKSFANEKQQCYVYDKQNKKPFPSNIKGILSERYFYDFDAELVKDCIGIDVQALEKILAVTIDDYWNNIVANIDANFEWFSLKYSWHFLDIYRCAAVQLMRTPSGKKMLLHMYNEVYGKEKDERFENIVLAKEVCNVLDENLKSVLLEIILNEYGHIAIGLNETSIPFITSDTPVFVMPNIWDKSKTEMMMYYPITPQRCIFFLKRKKVENQLGNVFEDVNSGKFEIADLADITQEAYRREKEMLKQLNPETIILREEDVLVFNTCCAETATRYVISFQNLEKEKLWIES